MVSDKQDIEKIAAEAVEVLDREQLLLPFSRFQTYEKTKSQVKSVIKAACEKASEVMTKGFKAAQEVILKQGKVIKSLSKSQAKGEPWTVQDRSGETVLVSPNGGDDFYRVDHPTDLAKAINASIGADRKAPWPRKPQTDVERESDRRHLEQLLGTPEVGGHSSDEGQASEQDAGYRLAKLLRDEYWAQTPLDVAKLADEVLSHRSTPATDQMTDAIYDAIYDCKDGDTWSAIRKALLYRPTPASDAGQASERLKAQLAIEIGLIRSVLTDLIGWIAQSATGVISINEAKQLLDKLELINSYRPTPATPHYIPATSAFGQPKPAPATDDAKMRKDK